MSAISVTMEDPRSRDATALLQASQALMRSLFPLDACHFLSIENMCNPMIRLYVARLSGLAVGCGALAIKGDYGEIKSMFTTDAARGQGVAGALLNQIEKQARQLGLACLRLETGDTLAAAHRLYARHGFETCGPFADYRDHPNSIFLEKSL